MERCNASLHLKPSIHIVSVLVSVSITLKPEVIAQNDWYCRAFMFVFKSRRIKEEIQIEQQTYVIMYCKHYLPSTECTLLVSPCICSITSSISQARHKREIRVGVGLSRHVQCFGKRRKGVANLGWCKPKRRPYLRGAHKRAFQCTQLFTKK